MPPSHQGANVCFENGPTTRPRPQPLAAGVYGFAGYLPAFLAQWMPDVAWDTCRGRRKRRFDEDHFVATWLHPEELQQLNRMGVLKRQIEWLAGRWIVKHLVVDRLAPALSLDQIQVLHDEHRAPFIDRFPNHCVTITHSGQWAAAAICMDARTGIGLDLECLTGRDLKAILKVGFSDRERKQLAPPVPKEVLRRWTIKEAYLKFIRKGFSQPLQKVEILAGRIYHDGAEPPGLRIHRFNIDQCHVMSLVCGDLHDDITPKRGATYPESLQN